MEWSEEKTEDLNKSPIEREPFRKFGSQTKLNGNHLKRPGSQFDQENQTKPLLQNFNLSILYSNFIAKLFR